MSCCLELVDKSASYTVYKTSGTFCNDNRKRLMAEPEPSYEPNPEIKRSATEEPYPSVEPRVDITAVSEVWRTAFKSHWIFFASCFALLVLYNGYQLYKTLCWSKMANKNYISMVQTLVILHGFTRALVLCLSPYELISNTPNRVPHIVPRLLFAFGFPCLFSGFTFVHKIFLNISKVQVMSQNALGNGLVAFVLVIHFIAVLSSEIITSYVKGTEFLLVICGLYYFSGCLGIAVSLLFSGRRVIRKTQQIRANLTQHTQTGTNNGKPFASGKTKDRTAEATLKVIRITALAAIFGALCALLYIYTIVWMIRAARGDNSTPAPWIWLIVNTFLRLFELFLAATMSYAVGCSYQRNTHARIFVTRCENPASTP